MCQIGFLNWSSNNKQTQNKHTYFLFSPFPLSALKAPEGSLQSRLLLVQLKKTPHSKSPFSPPFTSLNFHFTSVCFPTVCVPPHFLSSLVADHMVFSFCIQYDSWLWDCHSVLKRTSVLRAKCGASLAPTVLFDRADLWYRKTNSQACNSSSGLWCPLISWVGGQLRVGRKQDVLKWLEVVRGRDKG